MKATKPVPTGRRVVPLLVKLHAVLVFLPLCLSAWAGIGARLETTASSEGEITFLAVCLVTFGVLFFLMLDGKAWARILLGVLTLPVGFLLLGPRSSVEFTEPPPDAMNQRGRVL